VTSLKFYIVFLENRFDRIIVRICETIKKGVEQNPDASRKDEFDIILQVVCTRGDWLGKTRITLRKKYRLVAYDLGRFRSTSKI